MSRSSSPRRPLHGNDRLRRRRRAALALALATGVLLALPAAAPAQAGSSISIHAIFSGGKASGFNVGTVVQIRYSDPSGQTRRRSAGARRRLTSPRAQRRAPGRRRRRGRSA